MTLNDYAVHFRTHLSDTRSVEMTRYILQAHRNEYITQMHQSHWTRATIEITELENQIIREIMGGNDPSLFF